MAFLLPALASAAVPAIGSFLGKIFSPKKKVKQQHVMIDYDPRRKALLNAINERPQYEGRVMRQYRPEEWPSEEKEEEEDGEGGDEDEGSENE